MIFKKYFIAALSVLSLFILNSCGEGTVEVGPQTYEPKIVVEGYLQPGKKVEGIYITRNVPLNTEINPLEAILYNADVKITDMQTSREYILRYNPDKLTFQYDDDDLNIGYGKSYKISVNAAVAGKKLSASSVTTVPLQGFAVIPEESSLGTMKYYQKDSQGNVQTFKIKFNPSVGTTFYAVSTVALDASMDTFIYDNAYFEIKKDDLEKDFDRYKYQMNWMQNVNPEGGKREIEINWLQFWFYGNYRMIVYAADPNFKSYIQTHGNVQEFDGNFYEPRFNFEGDGIGIFGSYIADTVFVKVEK